MYSHISVFCHTGGMLSGINGCSDIFKAAVTILLVCLIHVGNTSFWTENSFLSSVLLIHNPLCPVLNIAFLIYADLVPGMCCVTSGTGQPEAWSWVLENYFDRSWGLLVSHTQCLGLHNVKHFLAAHLISWHFPTTQKYGVEPKFQVFLVLTVVCACLLVKQARKQFSPEVQKWVTNNKPCILSFLLDLLFFVFLNILPFWNCTADYYSSGCIIANCWLVSRWQYHEQ